MAAGAGTAFGLPRPQRGPCAAGALAALLLFTPAPGRSQDLTIVPGRMGYNALPTISNEDPVVEDDIRLELRVAAQLSDLSAARDAALTPFGRLVVPFRAIAALEVDAVPVELWRLSPETQRRIGAEHAQGVDLGDVRFGARFLVLSEGDARPALGIRFLTKSTTGKGLESRRFTNAPGYVIDALLGKNLATGLVAFDRLRLLAKVGFAAWQQGVDGQDDAIDYGATLQLRARAGTRLELEWRGYTGYEQRDKPRLLGLTAAHPTGPVEWTATVNRGLGVDAPPWELRAGIELRFRTPWS